MKGRKQHIAVVHSAGISDTRGIRLLLIRLSMMFTLAKIFRRRLQAGLH
jgi:hypothetical protein